jgi:hypothetical protein
MGDFLALLKKIVGNKFRQKNELGRVLVNFFSVTYAVTPAETKKE